MSEIKIANIPLSQILPGEQPRDGVTPESVRTMVPSSQQDGQLSPIGLEKTADGYRLRFGNTRLAAAKELGWTTILARIFPPEAERGDALRMAFVENKIRKSMTFVEQADVLFKYAEEKGLEISDAGQQLGLSQGEISKYVKTRERLTPANSKKLIDAGIGGSLAYLLSKEEDPVKQTRLVELAIKEKWTRKKIEKHFRQQQSSRTRVEHQTGAVKLIAEVSKAAEPNDLISALKAFAADVHKNGHLSLSTLAQVLKEQCHAVSSQG